MNSKTAHYQCTVCGHENDRATGPCVMCGEDLVAQATRSDPAPTQEVVLRSIPPATAARPVAAGGPETEPEPEEIRGIVSSLSTRTEGGQLPTTVWSFRVDEIPDRTTAHRRIPVEIRGRWLTGSITNGDVVVVDGPWVRGSTLEVESLYNESIGARIGSSVGGAGKNLRVGKAIGLWAVFTPIVLFLCLATIAFAEDAQDGGRPKVYAVLVGVIGCAVVAGVIRLARWLYRLGNTDHPADARPHPGRTTARPS